MQVLFLETAAPVLRRFRQYYADHPDLKWTAARAAYRTTLDSLKANPYSSHTFDHFDAVFERKITRTAFSLLYTVKEDTIFIIDLRDQRGFRSAAALRAFTAELRRRYRLDE